MLIVRILLAYLGDCIYIRLPLYNSFSFDCSVSIYLDFYSSWFLCSVLLISSFISIYSYFYIAPYSKPTYFL